ncbi:MAG: citrate lyase acyl carrier protein [Synergistaceae bacterium]|nr:citrate lyase acyl carrier protein [Synergistaceae bacterium]
MKSIQAGTLESMDCLVTLTEAPAGAGIKIAITGASAARFKSAMEKKIKETLAELGVKDIEVAVQDNGALDIVLGARVEAAYARLQKEGAR